MPFRSDQLEQGSDAWMQWRSRKIGSSTIAGAMGICPYSTPYQAWASITGRSKFEGNHFTEHGTQLEPAARARYELQTMLDMPPACATHPKFSMCIASLDGYNAEEKKILEIKCPKGRSVIDAALAGQVAPHYIPQTQWQLAVTGADSLDFFVYHEEMMIDKIITVLPDIEYQGRLIAGAIDFYERYVLTDTPPPLTDKDVKVVDDPLIAAICLDIESQRNSLPKHQLDFMKERVVRMAGHPKVKCGNVQISTVNRNGVFSYHKLTIGRVG